MRDKLLWLDGPLGLLLIIVLVLGVVAWYLTYLAGRLDRLHHRVESSRAALEARLARRAAIALRVARTLPPTIGEQLARAATQVVQEDSIDEGFENELTRTLHRTFSGSETIGPETIGPETIGPETIGPVVIEEDLATELLVAGERAELARRFHNDAVAHAQRMRRKRVVRWARLAGRARMPQMVEIDDSPPSGLLARVSR